MHMRVGAPEGELEGQARGRTSRPPVKPIPAVLHPSAPGYAAEQRSRRAILRYFQAVGARGTPVEEKLDRVAATFAPDGQIVAPDGRTFRGRAAVRSFYASAPYITSNPRFTPMFEEDTWTVSADGLTISCHLQLAPGPDHTDYGTDALYVHDVFKFNTAGEIVLLAVFLRQYEDAGCRLFDYVRPGPDDGGGHN